MEPVQYQWELTLRDQDVGKDWYTKNWPVYSWFRPLCTRVKGPLSAKVDYAKTVYRKYNAAKLSAPIGATFCEFGLPETYSPTSLYLLTLADFHCSKFVTAWMAANEACLSLGQINAYDAYRRYYRGLNDLLRLKGPEVEELLASLCGVNCWRLRPFTRSDLLTSGTSRP